MWVFSVRVCGRGGAPCGGRSYYGMDPAPVLTDPRLLDYDTSECQPTDSELTAGTYTNDHMLKLHTPVT